MVKTLKLQIAVLALVMAVSGCGRAPSLPSPASDSSDGGTPTAVEQAQFQAPADSVFSVHYEGVGQ